MVRRLWCACVWSLAVLGAQGAEAALPIYFEANTGQARPEVRFVGRTAAFSVLFERDEAVLLLRGASRASSVRMRILGANPSGRVVGADPLPGRSHYFIGRDPSRWHRDVPQYARVEYHDVYPGIDLAFYASGERLEYDFVVRPGADPGRIRLEFEGADALRLGDDGDLHVLSPAGEVVQHAPRVYQERQGVREAVAGRYRLAGPREVRFELGRHARGLPLVIDPVMSYSTFFGGTDGDGADAVAVDAQGNVYLAGTTASADFPLLNPYQDDLLGELDVFVAKFDPTGRSLIYATYLGGDSSEGTLGLAVDAAGSVHLTGSTTSGNFPRVSAVQPACDTFFGDAFVTKLSPSGSSLAYSTCLGGNHSDSGMAIAADAAGGSVVTGWTRSSDFPVANPLQPAPGGGHRDTFVTRFSPTGAPLVYSTYLGGVLEEDGFAIAVDAEGNAYVGGRTASSNFPLASPYQGQHAGGMYDATLTKLNPAGSALVFSTFFGGSSNDHVHAIKLDAAGRVIVAGTTHSIDFPTRNPAQAANGGWYDAFVATFDGAGRTLLQSTYLGGGDWDEAIDLAVTSHGEAVIAGYATSLDFPTANAVQPAMGGGLVDGFVAKLSADGSTWLHASYLGGGDYDTAWGVAANAAGTAWVTGQTSSTDFPTVDPMQPNLEGPGDAYLTRLVPDSLPSALAADASPSATSDGNGVLDPGETVTLAPSWLNDRTAPVTASGTASQLGGPAGAAYTLVDAAASYGTLPAGTAASCLAPGDCYAVAVSAPPARPAAHWDASFTESLSSGEGKTWSLHVGGSFDDVPRTSPFYRFVEGAFHHGLTGGCGAAGFCADQPVTRAQMAVFLLRARHHATYVPPPATGTVFADVPATAFAAAWIEQLAAEGITGGCGLGNFCPDAPVTRRDMAAFLIVAREGTRFVPPAAQGVFADVPATDPFARWIEELWRRGITGGCGANLYCPLQPVTRGQMAVFLSVAFGRALYGPQ